MVKRRFNRAVKWAHGGHNIVEYAPGVDHEIPEDFAKVADDEGWTEKMQPKPENKALEGAPSNKSAGEIHMIERARGWYDVIDRDGFLANDRRLRKAAAERLLLKLARGK